MITPVILCGGFGSRLWPLSRKAHPKYLISLADGHSMLQQTVLRLKSIPELNSPTIICNSVQRFVISEQLAQIGIDHPRIILEPHAKNTAPAIAMAAYANPQATLFILPADHQIKHPECLESAVATAKQLARKNYLITFGVQPRSAETAYGYIKKGETIEQLPAYDVIEFVEKPNHEKARKYLASNDYYWNSGMFMFTAALYLEELMQHSPVIAAACKTTFDRAEKENNILFLDATIFNQCPSDSIDYAVIEKSKKVAMVPLYDSGWNDLGAWNAIYDASEKNENNNVLHGDVHTENVMNSYLSANSRLLAVVGVSDHIVIETADAVLVAHKNAAQEIKKMTQQLAEKKRIEIESHRVVHRPWGCYEVLSQAPGVQIKRITVQPDAILSLQMHYHRAEHWIVVKGKAEVICDDKQFTLEANQSTFIPQQAKHRLKNVGTELLEIIEVQVGSYLGEDDIVRFEDQYGRVTEKI